MVVSAAAPLLSDSWYQVADARVSLLGTVRVQQQRYRGRPWVMLEDEYSHRFFRVTPAAYKFLRSLTPDLTVDQNWRAWATSEPDDVPGQDEVVRLLSQLHVASLLYFREQPRSEAIFQRAQTQRSRELLGKWLSFLFVRIPLVSPNRWLDRIHTLVRLMTGRAAAAVWLAVVLLGAAAAIEHSGALAQAGQGLLSLSNLPWLYAALTLVKVLHELAHAFVCKRYGGQVPSFGLMLLVFAPLPYVDASASWALRSKWQRAYVGAAGMLAELFMAAVGALVWANTGEGLVNSLAFNVMVVGSVSSLLINGNPQLRFDACYILSDIAELPNLYQKAQAQWLHYGNRWLLGATDSVEPAADTGERAWFIGYGALAFLYRLLVTATILLFVADQSIALGVVLLITTAIVMLGMPLLKLWRHLTSAALRRGRGQGRSRAVAGVVLTASALYGVLVLLPLPYALRLPGVLEAHRSEQVWARSAGTLAELAVEHGQQLRSGDLIARLENADLQHALQATRLQLVETQAIHRHALLRAPSEVAPLQSRIDALHNRLRELGVLNDQLSVRASQDGEWVAPALHERRGTWVERGLPLGELIDRSRLRFSAVLPQSQAAELFAQRDEQQPGAQGQFRLGSDRATSINVARLRLVPFQRQRLVSPVLGFSGGGEVAVRADDSSGTLASEPFFEIHAEPTDAALQGIVAYHGLSGVLRVPVAPRPLYARARATMQQLLQQRYSL